jgi:hypothetical protein
MANADLNDLIKASAPVIEHYLTGDLRDAAATS